MKKTKEKNYKVKTNVNGQIEVSTIKNGKLVSIADSRKIVVKRLETKTQVVKRLCSQLGVEY